MKIKMSVDLLQSIFELFVSGIESAEPKALKELETRLMELRSNYACDAYACIEVGWSKMDFTSHAIAFVRSKE